MIIEEAWMKIGEIAGLLAIGNGVVTVSAPVPLAEINGKMSYGVRFTGQHGESIIAIDTLDERDSDAWAGYLGAKLWP